MIHAPELEAGAKGVDGRNVLKTYRKKDVKFKPLMFAAVAGVTLVTFLVALLLRGSEMLQTAFPLPLVFGAIILGPPLAWAGYTFLRDSELEPYQGTALIVRSLICGLVYALCWGIYMFVAEQLFADKDFSTMLQLEIFQLVVLAAGVLGIGTFAAFVSFDLEPFAGFFGCAMFFGTTILLRLVLGLAALPGLMSG